MKVDAPLLATDLGAVPAEARAIEDLGCDGLFTFEGPHDPFFPLVVAAGHTSRVELATAIAIALPRSPMHLAQLAHDLQLFSKGRFVLGLGSQVRAHVERRFSATWDKPVARMREIVLATRAIWRCWNEGEKLDFRGEFYRHTLMTPLFKPEPSACGPPRIVLAGVGRPMTRMAAEVADGLFVHPMNSPDFLRGTTLPAIEDGLARAGRTANDFEVACQALVVTGFDANEMREAEETTRMQVAFYASTPAYRCVLEAHGWGEMQDELNRLVREGRWLEMGAVVDDRVLDAFAVRCEPDRVPEALAARYAGLVDRIAPICHARPESKHPTEWAGIVERMRAIATRRGR
ncbi:MAG: TIGR03617 family F420-dependent LLM class oxidoreductase [Alphaproteobacteria bacterium]